MIVLIEYKYFHYSQSRVQNVKTH